jgi:GNAT superfamily N-acetyltransferase
MNESAAMSNPPIHHAGRRDADRCIAALTLAFSSDPACRWAWPDPRQFLNAFPGFVRAFGGQAFDAGTAYRVGDYWGVALWLPPGESPDEEALVNLIRRTVANDLQDELLAVFEQQAAYHPQEPHWHLPLVGVDPARQNHGLGAALLIQKLTECDRDQLPVYLEATSPRNVPLYERHGFEALATIQLGTSPPITPMLRRPRSPT